MEILHAPLVAGFTVLQVVFLAVGIAILLALLRMLRRLFTSQTPGQYEARMKCRDCGWTGVVGKHHPVCRKCNGKSLRPA